MLRRMLSSEIRRKTAFPHLPATARSWSFPERYCTLSQPARCKCPASGQGLQHHARIQPLPASRCPGERIVALDLHRHCCRSEEAHVRRRCHETITLFNGERNKRSQSSSSIPCSCLRLRSCPHPRDGAALAGGEMLRRCP